MSNPLPSGLVPLYAATGRNTIRPCDVTYILWTDKDKDAGTAWVAKPERP